MDIQFLKERILSSGIELQYKQQLEGEINAMMLNIEKDYEFQEEYLALLKCLKFHNKDSEEAVQKLPVMIEQEIWALVRFIKIQQYFLFTSTDTKTDEKKEFFNMQQNFLDELI